MNVLYLDRLFGSPALSEEQLGRVHALRLAALDFYRALGRNCPDGPHTLAWKGTAERKLWEAYSAAVNAVSLGGDG